MRSSSSWRKVVDDPTVDIFGNKKRGGGGDPLKNERGHVIANASSATRFQEYQKSLATATPSTAANHLLSSVDVGLKPPSTTTDRIKTADELFREDLYRQIEEQKRAKYAAKLKEMEAERAEQERVKREIAALRQKHSSEIEIEKTEQGDGAGFMRFSHSHSHIPPSTQPQRDRKATVTTAPPIQQPPKVDPPRIQPLPSFGEVRGMNKENVSISRLTQLVQAMKPITPNTANLDIPAATTPSMMPMVQQQPISNQRDSRSMDLLQRQVVEQELELKRLRLQMLEQQNDQKTTLQYLLKLQTDFTEKLQQNHHQNASNIRRPLSAISRVSPSSELAELTRLRHIQSLVERPKEHIVHGVPAGISRVDSPLQSYDGGQRAISPPNTDIGASIISQSALHALRQPISSYFPERPVAMESRVQTPSHLIQQQHQLHEQRTPIPSPPKQAIYGMATQSQRDPVQQSSPPIQSKYIQHQQCVDADTTNRHRHSGHSAPSSGIPSQDPSPRRPVRSQHPEIRAIHAQNACARPRDPHSGGRSTPNTRTPSGYSSPVQYEVPQNATSQPLPVGTQHTFPVHIAQQPQRVKYRAAVPKDSRPNVHDFSEQKEESILMVDAESEPQNPSPSHALLRNESAFIVCSDIESEEEMADAVISAKRAPGMQGMEEMECLDDRALSSSTQFELSSRPTTAVPMDVIRQFGDRIAASSQNRKSLDENQANAMNGDESAISNLVNLSCSTFTVPDDIVEDDPFRVHVVVEDSMQCVTPPMDSNAVNDSILTVHEVDSDPDRPEMPSLERDENGEQRESVGDRDGEEDRSGDRNEEDWKRISKVDRDNVASLRSAFAEMSRSQELGNEDMSSVAERGGDGTSENKEMAQSGPLQKEVEEFSVSHTECKEEDEESEVEYEEDFEEEPEVDQMDERRGDSKTRAVFRLPELDSSINNFQSKVYSVYSSFDDTLMTHSVASSSDLSQGSPQQFRTACKTICE